MTIVHACRRQRKTMTGLVSILALSTVVSGCTNTNDLGNYPDGGRAGAGAFGGRRGTAGGGGMLAVGGTTSPPAGGAAGGGEGGHASGDGLEAVHEQWGD